ncbi:MAG: penicillin-binding protein 1C [Desulfovibrio sp.]|jgi:penicillin-binding protein 1C|nr:penicillin-binding protein 1C [Desulfovibrio sp.]
MRSHAAAEDNGRRNPADKGRRVPLLAAGAALCAAVLLWAAWRAVPDPTPEVLSWPVSPVLLDRGGTLIHARLSGDGEWCLPIPLEEMGEWLPRILTAVEDKRFRFHGGVDFLALGRALFQNLRQGRVVSGASTLTSQLVRLSHPRPRTFSAKLLEFAGAWKLEQSLSKDQILETYLNRAPFGGPIRGVEAAARLYFGKRARDLSLGEAALLVGLLKGPTFYRPDKNPAGARERRRRIIASTAKQAGLPDDLKELALAEPLPAFRAALPDKVRHFADLAFKTLPRQGGPAGSTLDMRVQELLERALASRLEDMDREVTAAGIVVENATGHILAYAGNSRFDPAGDSQWVDCALAPRSPGSALKPFIYLAAMEEGHIIPASLLADTPLRLGGRAPRNFDRLYRGPVRASIALASSLNAPAVRVLRLVGQRRALNFLRRAGFSHLNREDAHYGDSLVLGAGEVSLLELARAYSALANQGADRPLLLRRPFSSPASGAPSASLPSGLASSAEQIRYALSGQAPPRRQIHSAAAAFLITEILQDPSRLPFLAQLKRTQEEAPIALKTGTSFGLRDAWAAAYCPAYTVVVWFGKAAGGADPGIMGLGLAAPAAIRVLQSLNEGLPPARRRYEPPASLAKTRVCSLSGQAPSAFCPATRLEWHIPKVWRTLPCSLHPRSAGAVAWPPELEDYARKRVAREDVSRPAFMLSPLDGTSYLLTPGSRAQPLPLKAEGVAYPVHWFLEDKYLGEQTREDKPLYWTPLAGRHALSLLDSQNRVCSARVEVIDLAARIPEDEKTAPITHSGFR